MAFAIEFNGSTNSASIPTLTSSVVTTLSYDIEWISKNTSATTFWCCGADGVTDGVAIADSGDVTYKLNNVNYVWSTAAPSPQLAYHTFKIEVRFDGVSLKEAELFVDTISQGIVVITGSISQSMINNLGEIGGASRPGLLQEFKWTDNLTASNNQFYLIDEGSGTLIADSSGNGADGTLVGGAIWVAIDSGVITVANAPLANYVYQRNLSEVYSTSFAITFTGAPTQLEFRLLDATDDITEIIGWTIFDASPSGGVSTLIFNAPSSQTPYHVEVRSDVSLLETDLQTINWYVGCKVLIYGQSLALQLNSETAISPSASYFVFDGAAFVSPTVGAGANALANKIIDMYDCVCAISNSATSGSSLTPEGAAGAGQGNNYWANPASSNWTAAVSKTDTFTSTDGFLEFALWIQGQTDSVHNVSEIDYLRLNKTGGLNTLLTNSRDLWSSPDNPLTFIVSTLGRNTSTATDIGAQAVRDAILTMVNADVNISPVQVFQIPTVDGTHPTSAGYIDLGEITAVINASIRGDISSAPVPVFAEISGSDVIINFDKNLDASVTTYATQGILVKELGVLKTTTGFARTGAKQATITLSAAIVDETDIDIYIAYGTGSSSGALIYPESESLTLPNAAGTFKLPVENFNVKLSEV